MTLQLAQQIFLWLFGAGGVGAVGYLLRLRGEKRKLSADTNKVEIDAAEAVNRISLSLVEPLEARITKLDKELRSVRHDFGLKMRQVLILEEEIREQQVQIKDQQRQIVGLRQELADARREQRDGFDPQAQPLA